ncbi:NAD(P)/FAD-dependent oxidoreductase [Conexibacter sp. CPCC 206217]|uniref:NAD(P)/FAD-dependent oxidoreductase n=1 Tax=Conexibacter sp. CPCC 206217 TaxID=3064574 RepID=UPI00271A8425|nr:NAD(P)/FAD-dependent oxidoreductase [Conexibacter sp. CPCC 206217]MDO8208827.1 NAD(P)/FAD-dependent oxidoreductase [Conexibacter sp. CPCC 206217]
MSEAYDTIVVGARAAGSALAINLARSGQRVAVVDRASFPSDTLSTHVLYPNALAALDRLGALDEILWHEPPPLHTSWHHENVSWRAAHTPIAGRDWALCVRRFTLDAILVRRARAAGATVHERFFVERLLGAGTDTDPVHGIAGRFDGVQVELRARQVVGADGARSTVARLLGVGREEVAASPTAMAYAYWRGIPRRELQEFYVQPPWTAMHFPADDGYHVVAVLGPHEGWDGRPRAQTYLARVHAVPQLRRRLERARMSKKVIAATALDGFWRRPTGPGWTLVGDAGHFKHPAAVQGIADALAAAEALAPMLLAGTQRRAFGPWRESANRELYDFSRRAARAPERDETAALMRALAREPALARDFVDVYSRTRRPSELLDRLAVAAA